MEEAGWTYKPVTSLLAGDGYITPSPLPPREFLILDFPTFATSTPAPVGRTDFDRCRPVQPHPIGLRKPPAARLGNYWLREVNNSEKMAPY